MWRGHKAAGLARAAGMEAGLFYPTFEGREARESSARQVGMWLSTYRPMLLQCKGRASGARRVQRKRQRKRKKKEQRWAAVAAAVADDDSDGSEWSAGCSSAGSAGEGGSAAPMALGPGGGALGLLE